MKLQVALDFISDKKAFKIAGKVEKYADIIEAGTPLIKSCGISVVKKLKKAFPKKLILADMKTMDTGFLESEMAFRNGADIVNICGSAPDATIKGAVKAAKKYRKKISADLIGVKDSAKRAKKLMSMKVNYIEVHTGIDEQKKGKKVTANLKEFRNFRSMSVAGGINLNNVDDIIKFNPEIIIVGGAITKSKNPGDAAKKLRMRFK